MAEAALYKDPGAFSQDVTAPEAVTSCEIFQLGSGKAGVAGRLRTADSGDLINCEVAGQFTVTKIATAAVLEGGRLWWDRSSSHATPIKTADSFFLGTAVKDAATTATTCVVDLNAHPEYAIELGKGQWTEASTNGLGAVTMTGGTEIKLAFDAVAEAAMAALYSVDTVPCADGPIFEAQVAIYDIGDDAALDITIGLANGTHATDFDSVTEAVVLHLDGSALSILAESDDGTTEVAATDTTVDAVDDTYFEVWIDCRDLTDIQVYIDGALVLGATTFKLDAATGPLLAIAHIEKTNNDTPADVRVKHMTVRATDLAAS
jgi:predicted RecA/RadA family phage recombinase